jgi:hypothetical protein
MIVLRMLAIVFAVCLVLTLVGVSIYEGEGSIGYYMYWTFRSIGAVTVLIWFAVWWFSSDRRERK